jgi:pyruvate,water dikinase
MFTKNFEEINKDMFQECGGKAAHLGELTSLKLNVPRGFCVVDKAYSHHLKTNNLENQIATIANSINFDDFQDMEEKTSRIRSLIGQAPMPKEIEKEIIATYECLSKETSAPFVAIRSSVAVKDSDISSFPGMMDTYHYIRGAKDVVENVKNCWASVWSGRASFSRYNKKIDYKKAVIAPTIQLMINSEIAGVAFTVNPVSGRGDEIVIEANWGLGESVVSGKCLCDFYVAGKKQHSVKEEKIARKEQKFIQAEGGGGEWVEVEPDKVNEPTLTEARIAEICKTACMIEDHYGYPQDIEWAYEKGDLYILQARRARVAGE